jgi:hypothetical protein
MSRNAIGHSDILHSSGTGKRNGVYKGTVHQLCIDLGKPVISYGTNLVQCGVPIKLFGLIKMWLNETCSKVQRRKHLFDVFPIQIGLKQAIPSSVGRSKKIRRDWN